MELLPAEMLNEILLQVDKSTLFEAAQVCKQWRHLAVKQVVPIKTYQNFKSACSIDDRLSIIQSNCVQDWINDGFIAACQGGHQDLVQLLITKDANDWNYGLYAACEDGYQELVQLMITKGANDWNTALYNACGGGHQTLAELMITKGANDWNRALYAACVAGHQALVQLMITKGANNWNIALYGACRGGHQALVQLMITKGANRCRCRKLLALH